MAKRKSIRRELHFASDMNFIACGLKAFESNLSAGQLDEANTSLIILKSDLVKFSDSYLVETVVAFLMGKDRLSENNRKRSVIHPLVLAVK